MVLGTDGGNEAHYYEVLARMKDDANATLQYYAKEVEDVWAYAKKKLGVSRTKHIIISV